MHTNCIYLISFLLDKKTKKKNAECISRLSSVIIIYLNHLEKKSLIPFNLFRKKKLISPLEEKETEVNPSFKIIYLLCIINQSYYVKANKRKRLQYILIKIRER